MGKSLKHGDPLARFLFLVVSENLNILMEEAMDKGLYEGIKVGNKEIMISQLQFVDDAIFSQKWSRSNVKNLVKVLSCFKALSGLKINFKKARSLD